MASILVNALTIMTSLHSTISQGIKTQTVSLLLAPCRHLVPRQHTLVHTEIIPITLCSCTILQDFDIMALSKFRLITS